MSIQRRITRIIAGLIGTWGALSALLFLTFNGVQWGIYSGPMALAITILVITVTVFVIAICALLLISGLDGKEL